MLTVPPANIYPVYPPCDRERDTYCESLTFQYVAFRSQVVISRHVWSVGLATRCCVLRRLAGAREWGIFHWFVAPEKSCTRDGRTRCAVIDISIKRFFYSSSLHIFITIRIRVMEYRSAFSFCPKFIAAQYDCVTRH